MPVWAQILIGESPVAAAIVGIGAKVLSRLAVLEALTGDSRARQAKADDRLTSHLTEHALHTRTVVQP